MEQLICRWGSGQHGADGQQIWNTFGVKVRLHERLLHVLRALRAHARGYRPTKGVHTSAFVIYHTVISYTYHSSLAGKTLDMWAHSLALQRYRPVFK